MLSKLAEIDFPGITFTKKFKVRNWLDLAGSHEIATHARETTQKSVNLMANPRDLATMTMYRYTKYWFVKIMLSKLAEIDFPGITFTKKFKVRNWLDLAGSHEISTHACETTQKSVNLMANPRDLATMTMYRYTKYWFVKNITESFTSFVLFFLYVLKS